MAAWGSRTMRLTPDEEAELAAWRLAAWLAKGNMPPDISPRLPGGGWLTLAPGETCKFQTACLISVYCAADVAYDQGFFVAGGSAKAVGASLAASALYNRKQRSRAEAQAQPQWRPAAEGPLIVTSQRLILAGDRWVDFAYRDFTHASHTVLFGSGTGISLGVSGLEPMLLQVGRQSLWLYVLLTRLCTGRIPDLPMSRSLNEKVRRSKAEGASMRGADGGVIELPDIVPDQR